MKVQVAEMSVYLHVPYVPNPMFSPMLIPPNNIRKTDPYGWYPGITFEKLLAMRKTLTLRTYHLQVVKEWLIFKKAMCPTPNTLRYVHTPNNIRCYGRHMNHYY